jgi:methionyl-tRNA synthetase
VHLIGKDILRQHAIYWPAFLLAANIEQPLAIIGHGTWLDHLGRKMSKTLGNSIELPVLRRYFAPDIVRYFCLREMAFGQDSKFGYEALIDRANSDLASGLGNLSSRTLTMIGRYCDGLIPAPDIDEEKRLQAKRAGIDADGQELATALEHARDSFVQHFDDYAFQRALEAAWSVIARADKMISDAKPWELAKDASQKQTLNAVLYRAAETLRWLAVLLHPVMPDATRAIWGQLGRADDVAQFDPTQLQWGGTGAGTRIGEIAPVFPRIDKAKIMAEIEKENQEKEAATVQATTTQAGTRATEADAVPASNNPAATQPEPPQRGATEADAVPASPQETLEGVATLIGIEDFIKVELRVGEILTAERVPKSDKLLRFTIDLGEAAPRQILAGIAEYYEPDKLVGRKIVVVANLKPRKLRGFESQGMVLAASIGDEGRPVLATFAEDVPNGARLK